MKRLGFPGSLQLLLINFAGLLPMGLRGGKSIYCLSLLDPCSSWGTYRMPQQTLAGGLRGIHPHLGHSSKPPCFKVCLEASPGPLRVPGLYGEGGQGGASHLGVGMKEAFQGDQL